MRRRALFFMATHGMKLVRLMQNIQAEADNPLNVRPTRYSIVSCRGPIMSMAASMTGPARPVGNSGWPRLAGR